MFSGNLIYLSCGVSYYSPKMTMFVSRAVTAPAFMGLIVNIICAFLVIFFFHESNAGLQRKVSLENGRTEEHARFFALPKYDRMAVMTCIFTRFAQMFVIANLETHLFTEFGPRPAWGMEIVFAGFCAFLWIHFYKRIIPLKLPQNLSSGDMFKSKYVPSFCTGSDHCLHRAKIRFNRKLEKNPLHRPRGKSIGVYDVNVLNDLLSKRDWQIKEDLTEDYELLAERLKSCSEFASVPPARISDRLSINTKELLEKRRQLKLDPAATRLTSLVINANCTRALQEDLQQYMQKKILEAAEQTEHSGKKPWRLV
ncbi:unnamed protein product [Angiostrongylus costaricensis]|uniref:Neur_chan_memb domain-containing protein n=1 Tax=Angiostrongylus costaricensis TaxID=334426 RepID=A0A158PLY3_ANGCS|nr:unnamed protein product [Angiostrongylus costaricensis]